LKRIKKTNRLGGSYQAWQLSPVTMTSLKRLLNHDDDADNYPHPEVAYRQNPFEENAFRSKP
jgi:hypothetical protein